MFKRYPPARMAEMRSAYKILVGKPEEEISLGRPRGRLENILGW
jgi:hypothetical protein